MLEATTRKTSGSRGVPGVPLGQHALFNASASQGSVRGLLYFWILNDLGANWSGFVSSSALNHRKRHTSTEFPASHPNSGSETFGSFPFESLDLPSISSC